MKDWCEEKYQKLAHEIMQQVGLAEENITSSEEKHARTVLVTTPTVRINDSKEYGVEIPLPIHNDRRMYIFLHECGHIRFRHLTTRFMLEDLYKEYEAESWAFKIMAENGLDMPDALVAEAKENVRGFLTDQLSSRYPHIKHWCDS